ncbi:MAG: hypothetical protein OES46_11465 [Gammaproteobacteria bacterium]|nr:hypothetical protein [Gammaproteobacteria bacterium]
MRCIIDVAYLTGLRKKDILKIRLSDITSEGLYVEHSKTGKRVVFELTAALADVITRARGLRRRVGHDQRLRLPLEGRGEALRAARYSVS